MIRWGEMMRRRGGGDVGRYFTDELYMQWLQLPLALEDFPYRDMDYTGDPDAPRPPRQAWGPDGMYHLDWFVQFYVMDDVCLIYIVTDNWLICRCGTAAAARACGAARDSGSSGFARAGSSASTGCGWGARVSTDASGAATDGS